MMDWHRLDTDVIPKACVHKPAKMAGTSGDDNDLGPAAEQERLGGEDDNRCRCRTPKQLGALAGGLLPKAPRPAAMLRRSVPDIGSGRSAQRHPDGRVPKPCGRGAIRAVARRTAPPAERQSMSQWLIATTSGASLGCVTSPSGPESSRR